MKFTKLIDAPTHMKGGTIDHLYVWRPPGFTNILINWELFSPFYSDHFGISITINKEKDVFKSILSTVPDYLIEENVIRNNTQDTRRVQNHGNISASKRKSSNGMSATASKHS